MTINCNNCHKDIDINIEPEPPKNKRMTRLEIISFGIPPEYVKKVKA